MNEQIYYYLNANNEPTGPFTLEALKKEPIVPTTLVWHNKLTDWVEAGTLPELSIPSMPPIPPQQTVFAGNIIQATPTVRHEVYNMDNQKDRSNEKLGCLLGGVYAMMPLLGVIMFIIYTVRGEKAKAKTTIIITFITIVILSLLYAIFYEGITYYEFYEEYYYE
jgi:hypothetical protein